MRQYSIAKVKGDFLGLGSLLDKLTTVKARNYDDAVDKAIKKLHLKKGDVLSILALQGNLPGNLLGVRRLLPARYEYEI